MPATYEPIATWSATSQPGNISFTSITSGFTDLIIIVENMKNTSTQPYLRMQFNSDSSAIYSTLQMYGNGSSVLIGGPLVNRNDINLDYSAAPNTSTIGARYIHIFNYANSNIHKQVLWQSIGGAGGVDIGVGRWRNTNAITSILIGQQAGNFADGSRITLYGIKAAS